MKNLQNWYIILSPLADYVRVGDKGWSKETKGLTELAKGFCHRD